MTSISLLITNLFKFIAQLTAKDISEQSVLTTESNKPAATVIQLLAPGSSVVSLPLDRFLNFFPMLGPS